MYKLLKMAKENERLREENRRLKKEIELEKRVYLHWKTVAELFHDALWKALIKYDPEQYVEKRNRRDGEQKNNEEPDTERKQTIEIPK